MAYNKIYKLAWRGLQSISRIDLKTRDSASIGRVGRSFVAMHTARNRARLPAVSGKLCGICSSLKIQAGHIFAEFAREDRLESDTARYLIGKIPEACVCFVCCRINYSGLEQNVTYILQPMRKMVGRPNGKAANKRPRQVHEHRFPSCYHLPPRRRRLSALALILRPPPHPPSLSSAFHSNAPDSTRYRPLCSFFTLFLDLHTPRDEPCSNGGLLLFHIYLRAVEASR